MSRRSEAVVDDMERSREDFERFVRPLAEGALRGYFEVVEGNPVSSFNVQLDTVAGIDLWILQTGQGIRGVANRVQWGRNYRTFTIRAERESQLPTELQKVADGIARELLYPALRLHAYVSAARDELLGFAIARNRDLLDMVRQGKCHRQRTGPAQIGQAEFIVIAWNDIRRDCRWLYEWPPRTGVSSVRARPLYSGPSQRTLWDDPALL